MGKKNTYNNLSDSVLVAAVKEGDTNAFDALFLRWYPQVLKFIQTLVKDNAIAEDLSQTVKSLKNYLIVLGRNAALDIFKSKRPCLIGDMAPVASEQVVFEQTEQSIEYKEVNVKILRAMKNMPLKRRQIFYLSRFMAQSNEDIAEKLGISVRTVEKHIQLALQDLRKFLS